jgi:adenine-specific DNA-methyltransferase
MPTLHWIGKEKVINHHQDVPYRILDKQYTFNNDEGSSENKIIHGDNLGALKSLLPEYEGKIKCIYIDPPYNTGNEGWVYNDNVNDPKIKKWLDATLRAKETNLDASIGVDDLARHDKWLCMMYPRLKLLHKLLSDDGALFISIDDNEQANLRLICDEIFGSKNFINNIIWQKKYSPQNDARYLSDMHDFILCYSKQKDKWNRNLIARNESQDSKYKNPDNDNRGRWKASDFSVKTYSSSYDYPIVTPSGKTVYPPSGRSWGTSKERFQELVEDNRIWFGSSGQNVPSLKRFLTETQQGTVPLTLWLREEVGDNQEAKQILKQIFDSGNFPFDTPKPSRLIEKILAIASDKDSIILDSFAGSGTTAHAVLNLNKADGGNRKFILIEMEEYADTITAERVKRVINGYGEGNKAVEGTGGNFSYYTLGETVFLEDGFLNENIGIDKINEYVWFTETRTKYEPQTEPYLLGKKEGTAYYFFYDKDSGTTLDESFLRKVKTKADQYIIYADNCLLDEALMQKYNIVFKKIPRDITRF